MLFVFITLLKTSLFLNVSLFKFSTVILKRVISKTLSKPYGYA